MIFFLAPNLISRWPLKLSKRGASIRWNSWIALDWTEYFQRKDAKDETNFWLDAFFCDWRIQVSKLQPQFRILKHAFWWNLQSPGSPGLQQDAGNQFKLNASIWNNWIMKLSTRLYSLHSYISTEKRVHLASSYIYYIFKRFPHIESWELKPFRAHSRDSWTYKK